MSNQQKSLVDKILDKLRSNPLIAVLIITAMFVIGLGQVLGGLEQIGRFWPIGESTICQNLKL